MGAQLDLPVIGSWGAEKLGCLADYLRAYTTALKNQRFGCVYIDAFAGAGSAYVRTDDPDDDLQGLFEPGDFGEQEGGVLAGPPRVALATDPPFDVCVFIERDPDRLRQLAQLRAEY